MTSWFDEIDTTPSEFDDFLDEGTLPEELRRDTGERTAPSRSSVLWVSGAGVGLVALVGLVVALSSGGSTPSSAAAPPPDQAVAVDPASQVAVAGQCKPEEGEITLSSADTSLRSTVAKWQKAYYSRDTALTEYLTADSWMRDQDWGAILPEAAPDGVSWCAVMAPVKGDRVDVDVMVTFSDGSSQTFKQTVVGKQQSGTWLIADIEAR